MEKKIKITTGDLELIDSKVFFAYKDSDTTVDLVEGNEKLSVILKFKKTEKDSDKIEKSSKVINDKTLEIVFTNYNSRIGSFTLNPWKIGNIDNRNLYIVYTIYELDDSEFKRMDIAFYLGKEDNNG